MMADGSSDSFENWYEALRAVSAVVKLFAANVLKLPDDLALLERLERAETAARHTCHATPSARRLIKKVDAPTLESVSRRHPEGLSLMDLDTSSIIGSSVAIMGSSVANISNGLPSQKAEQLTKAYSLVKTDIEKQRPQANEPLGVFKTVLLNFAAGVVAPDVTSELNHLIQFIDHLIKLKV
jgi:hypothetical protein